MNLKREIPIHVVIIPDGNRRWARKNGLAPTLGHKKSAEYENIKSLFDEAKKLGIKYLSVWGFSTENWKRERKEINVIFEIVLNLVKKLRKDAHEQKIRFLHLGRKDRLPKEVLEELRKLEKETENYSDFNVQLCMDYGGRDEIVRAAEKILSSGKKINEEEFSKHLDSSGIPDPDMIIRTSGEQRISGFMPFQSVYSELYFVKKFFPDFGRKDLRKAVAEFSKRKRRFGK